MRRWTRRRPLSALTWPLDDAPTERERLRALAELAARDARAGRRARARERLGAAARARASTAFRAADAASRIRSCSSSSAARTTFNVTELERFADCSSAWFVERFLDPRSIDAEVDPKLRGSVAHSALFKFFTRLPKELGVEKLDERVEDGAVRLMRACLDEALAGVRMEMTEMQARELDQTLWRDLEALVREECASRAAARAAPLRGLRSAASARRRSCSAGSTSATA